MQNAVDEMTDLILNRIDDEKQIFDLIDFEQININILNNIYFNYQSLDSKLDLLISDMTLQFNQHKSQFDILENQFLSMSPTLPLERGYALLLSNNKRIPADNSLHNYEFFDILRANEKITAKVIN